MSSIASTAPARPGTGAVIRPIEPFWEIHGLPTGHPPGDERIGQPFDLAYLPGVPAVNVKPGSVAAILSGLMVILQLYQGRLAALLLLGALLAALPAFALFRKPVIEALR